MATHIQQSSKSYAPSRVAQYVDSVELPPAGVVCYVADADLSGEFSDQTTLGSAVEQPTTAQLLFVAGVARRSPRNGQNLATGPDGSVELEVPAQGAVVEVLVEAGAVTGEYAFAKNASFECATGASAAGAIGILMTDRDADTGTAMIYGLM